MKLKLRLKHLRNYPATLMFMWEGVPCSFEGLDYATNSLILERVNVKLDDDVKPILRPMKDIYNIEEIMDEFSEYSLEQFEITFFSGLSPAIVNKLDNISYGILRLLFKYHFDVFGLIENGLALDKNEARHARKYDRNERK